MVSDKEILIEELEEHIAQVREATFKNPFVCIELRDRLIMNALIAHQSMVNLGMDNETWNECRKFSIWLTSDQIQ